MLSCIEIYVEWVGGSECGVSGALVVVVAKRGDAVRCKCTILYYIAMF